MPHITGVQKKYHVGDKVNVNCTSYRSKPAASLSWYINGGKVRFYFNFYVSTKDPREDYTKLI